MRTLHLALPAATALTATIGLYLLTTGGDAEAVVLQVDRFDDAPLATACTAAPMDCSVRGAVTTSNTLPGEDVISLPNGTYTLTTAGENEDNNALGDLDILQTVTITGSGIPTTIVEGISDPLPPHDRIFHVHPGATARISNLTVRDGEVSAASVGGGAVRVDGILQLTDATVQDSLSNGIGGGGIFVSSTGSATLTRVRLTQNRAPNGDGGAIYKADGLGSLTVVGGVILNNTAVQGGGLEIGLSSSATITDTMLSGNSATFMNCQFTCANGGGAIHIGADNVQITGGSITANSAPNAAGGGILSLGDLTINGTDISDNTAGDGRGGGIFLGSGAISRALITSNSAITGGGIHALSTVTINETSILQNTAEVDGGGINAQGLVTLIASTLHLDHAGHSGGGIFVGDGGSLSVTNSTISGNSATLNGGGIHRGPSHLPPFAAAGFSTPGPVSLSHVTLASNFATAGAGIDDALPVVSFTARNTIVANNTGSPNCSNPIDSLGYNIEDADTCGFILSTDKPNTEPLLGALGNNGGPTFTQPLLPGSPAIDAANPSCPPPNTDQRGIPRPQGFRCDIGAFESTMPPTPTLTPSPTASPSPTPTPGVPTPTPSPTPTPPPEISVRWGDHQCDGDVDSVDVLADLRFIASLSPLPQTEPCPGVGDDVEVDGQTEKWGDVDCNGFIDSVDALKGLRQVAGLSYTQNEPCPDIGQMVEVTV